MDIPELGFFTDHKKIEFTGKIIKDKRNTRYRARKLTNQTISLIKNMNYENELELIKEALLKLMLVLNKHENNIKRMLSNA